MKRKDLPALLKPHTVAHRMNCQTKYAYISQHTCGLLFNSMFVTQWNSIYVKQHAFVCIGAFLCVFQYMYYFQAQRGFVKGNQITTTWLVKAHRQQIKLLSIIYTK